MKKKRIIAITIFLSFICVLSIETFAHPGRTDANGGHYNRKTGEYHYHNGGGSSSGTSSSSGGGSSSSYSNTPKKVYASKVNVPNVPESINIGESVQLKGSVYPEDAVDKDISWESSDTSIVTIDENGNLKAVGNGTATVTAKTSNGTESKYIITVKEVMAEKIEIHNKPEQIFVDEKVLLNVVFTPKNTTNKTVEWKSADETVAKISPSGEIVGIGVGKTKITASNKDKIDEFEVTVNPIEATSIEIFIEGQDDKLTDVPAFKKGETMQLNVNFIPENTTNKTVKWTVDNNEIATIDESGLLTGHKSGKAAVKASVSNEVYDTIEVKVLSDTSFVITGFLIITIIAVCILLVKKKKNKRT
ncbi:MAG: YHYH domain-containing protein [Clostridia bacterium]|nr:YHYH domain-containing protein [Clostridia bacterium]